LVQTRARALGRSATCYRPIAERLEDRTVPSITIQIDYSLDFGNFFDSPLKRALLQGAADSVAARLQDQLAAVVPSGGDTWTVSLTHPATGETIEIDNPIIQHDTILVFVGARDLDDALAIGGFGGLEASGTRQWVETVVSRGQRGALAPNPTDFGPWGGAIAFDAVLEPGSAWHFGITTDGLDPNETDFYSIAVHEVAHVLGFGTAESWTTFVTDGRFTGRAANDLYAGPDFLPLSEDGGHWAEDLSFDGFETALDPSLEDGIRKLLTPLDWAALADIGWQISVNDDSPAENGAAGGTAPPNPSSDPFPANTFTTTVSARLIAPPDFLPIIRRDVGYGIVTAISLTEALAEKTPQNERFETTPASTSSTTQLGLTNDRAHHIGSGTAIELESNEGDRQSTRSDAAPLTIEEFPMRDREGADDSPEPRETVPIGVESAVHQDVPSAAPMNENEPPPRGRTADQADPPP
jgi:hypothetical protein